MARRRKTQRVPKVGAGYKVSWYYRAKRKTKPLRDARGRFRPPKIKRATSKRRKGAKRRKGGAQGALFGGR